MDVQFDLEPGDLRVTGRNDGAYCPRRALLMAKLSAMAYVKKQADLESRLREGGFEILAVFGMVKAKNAPRHNTQGFVARAGDIAVVVYRGSDEIRDFLLSLNGQLIRTVTPGGTAMVHRGYHTAFSLTRAEVHTALQEALRRGAKEFHFTGHSFGGAVAALAAALTQQVPTTAAWSFGAPKVCNGTLLTTVNFPYHRHVMGNDLVTALPPRPWWSLWHPVEPKLLACPGGATRAPEVSDWAKVAANIGGIMRTLATFELSLRDHHQDDYVRAMCAMIAADTAS